MGGGGGWASPPQPVLDLRALVKYLRLRRDRPRQPNHQQARELLSKENTAHIQMLVLWLKKCQRCAIKSQWAWVHPVVWQAFSTADVLKFISGWLHSGKATCIPMLADARRDKWWRTSSAWRKPSFVLSYYTEWRGKIKTLQWLNGPSVHDTTLKLQTKLT